LRGSESRAHHIILNALVGMGLSLSGGSILEMVFGQEQVSRSFLLRELVVSLSWRGVYRALSIRYSPH